MAPLVLAHRLWAGGAVAQLGERRNRTAEVRGSNPLGSTRTYRHPRGGAPCRTGVLAAPSDLFAHARPATCAHRSFPGSSMRALFLVIDLALDIYIWLLIAAAILSWLVAFNVVNSRNQVVAMVGDFLYRITEPALRPIRNLLPDLGGIDISPVILILIIIFIRYVIALYILPNVY